MCNNTHIIETINAILQVPKLMTWFSEGLALKQTSKKLEKPGYLYLYFGVGINVFSLYTSWKCTPYNQKVYTTRECTLNIGNYQPPKVVRFFSSICIWNFNKHIEKIGLINAQLNYCCFEISTAEICHNWWICKVYKFMQL